MHPEAYDLARQIVIAAGRDLRAIQSAPEPLRMLKAETFVSDKFGLPTVRDILQELEKPGRDPRPSFKTATLRDGVETITDLKPGMQLEGTVTNVATFGAFVDIGVHQDGLVHVSQLADRFVKDPGDIVKTGDIVSVRVTEVDVERKRIALSMRREADGGASSGPGRQAKGRPEKSRPEKDQRRPAAAKPGRQETTGALGAKLMEAMKKR